MPLIYILYLFVILLFFIITFLILDNRLVRIRLQEKPMQLQLKLREKMKIYKAQQVKLSNLSEIQHEMDEKIVQMNMHLTFLKEISEENKSTEVVAKMMELNMHFTTEQINKSMKLIQELKSEKK